MKILCLCINPVLQMIPHVKLKLPFPNILLWAMDEGLLEDSIFHYFQKKIDTVQHFRLLMKVWAYEIGSQIYEWLKDWISVACCMECTVECVTLWIEALLWFMWVKTLEVMVIKVKLWPLNIKLLVASFLLLWQ